MLIYRSWLSDPVGSISQVWSDRLAPGLLGERLVGATVSGAVRWYIRLSDLILDRLLGRGAPLQFGGRRD